MKTRALQLLRVVTKNRQRALAAIFAPAMIAIAALASLATNASASSSPAGGSAGALVRPADEPISSIKTEPPTDTSTETQTTTSTQTTTETDSDTPTYTTTAPDSDTPTYTTTAPDSDTPTYTTTAPDSETPTYTTTAPDSETPTVTITETESVTPTQTITVKPTPTPKCVSNSKSVSYYKDVKGGIDVVVVGHNLVLCHPIYAQSVGWTYEKTTSMWPQNDPVPGKLVVIAKSGTYFVPAGVGCQIDFYASIGKAPAYPTVLTAPGKPYEPKFLNAYFSGTNAVLFYITPAQCQCGKQRATL